MRRGRLTVEEYTDGILRGDRSTLARAITLVESQLPRDQDLASEVVERCLPRSGRSIRIGITGVPGAGKSTFLESLGSLLTDTRGEKIAVLAVDPSSPVTGGSILGDKTRMVKLSANPNAYVRPSAAGGSLGGVARRTREAILLCEAAGFSTIFVETVGVGQSETAVADMVDFFLLLMLARSGDELQGIKRGIVEMADLIAINKADGDNRLAAEVARGQLETALRYYATRNGWQPRVLTCSALENQGVDQVWKVVEEFRAQAQQSGSLDRRRQDQLRKALRDTVHQSLEASFFQQVAVRELLPEVERDVAERRITIYSAARRLLAAYEEHI